MVARVIVAALEIIAAASPGFLAAFSGYDDDEQALASARKAIDAIPLAPGAAGVERWRRSFPPAGR